VIDLRVEHLYWFLSVPFSLGITSDHSSPSICFNHIPSFSLIQNNIRYTRSFYGSECRTPLHWKMQDCGTESICVCASIPWPERTAASPPRISTSRIRHVQKCTSACVRTGQGKRRLHGVAMAEGKAPLSPQADSLVADGSTVDRNDRQKTNQYNPRYLSC
jgi:hypothetical protein